MNDTHSLIEDALLDVLWLTNGALFYLMFTLILQNHGAFASAMQGDAIGAGKGIPIPQVCVCEVLLPRSVTPATANARVMVEVNGRLYPGPIVDLLTAASQDVTCDDWTLKIGAASVRNNVGGNVSECRRLRVECSPLEGNDELPLTLRLHCRVDYRVPAHFRRELQTLIDVESSKCDQTFPRQYGKKSNNPNEFRSRGCLPSCGAVSNASLLLNVPQDPANRSFVFRVLTESPPEINVTGFLPGSPSSSAPAVEWCTAYVVATAAVRPAVDPDVSPHPTMAIEIRPTAKPPAELRAAAFLPL